MFAAGRSQDHPWDQLGSPTQLVLFFCVRTFFLEAGPNQRETARADETPYRGKEALGAHDTRSGRQSSPDWCIDTPAQRAYIFPGPHRMSATPFGEHLKREREMRGVSLDEISAATRISTRFLEALETEQWDRLPGGAFNRGFIRSIARFLGIDEDALVAEYAFERRDAETAGSPAAHAERIPRNWQPAALAIVALLFVLAVGLLGFHRYGTAIAARLHARLAGVKADTRGGPTANSAGATTVSASKQTPASDPSSLAPALDLTLQASKPIDAMVVADGKTSFAAILQPGDAKQFHAQDSLEIDSSEPSVLTLHLNGRVIPWAEAAGQPGKITLTRNDLQPAPEAAH